MELSLLLFSSCHVMKDKQFGGMAQTALVIKKGGVGEDDAVLIQSSIAFVSMTKEVVSGFHLLDSIEQWEITPMSAS